MITRDMIESKYYDFRQWGKEFYQAGEIDNALESIEIACRIAHEYFIRLEDSILEELLLDISKTFEITNKNATLQSFEFILYDSVAIDNMALTQQYLRALIAWDVKFLYILNDYSEGKRATKILEEVNSSKNGKVFVVPSGLSYTEKIDSIIKTIHECDARNAFLHMDVSDVVGVIVWNCVSSVNKFFINHADHAFWIGKQCSDYFLCYRTMGVFAAINHRNINKKKLLIQPYYPIVPSAVEKDHRSDGYLEKIKSNNRIKLYSGGRYFKIYAEGGYFMSLIAEILLKNPKIDMYFIGSGDDRSLINFIKRNGLESRWHSLSYVTDFFSIIKEMDIYIGTYPLNGGLMAMYAAYFGKPVVELNANNGSVIEDIFCRPKELPRLTFNRKEELFEEVDRLIKNEDYRIQKGQTLSTAVQEPDEFNELLKYNIEDCFNEKMISRHDEYNLEVDALCKNAIERENHFMPLLNTLVLSGTILKKKSKVQYCNHKLLYYKGLGLKVLAHKTAEKIKNKLLR